MNTLLENPSIAATAPPFSDLTPYTGAWATEQVVHLLKRTMFGAAKADIDLLLTLTPAAAVQKLLTAPATPPSPPVNNYNANVVDPDIAPGQTWVNTPSKNVQNLDANRTQSYRDWWTGVMINETTSIQEKMVLFWHNHFATQTTAVGVTSNFGYYHNVTLRKYALGNFKDFVKAITIDPSMLAFLNGKNNVVGAPDENYGREVQELFTIGKNADGTTPYTEADVQAAARLLTGYQIDGTNFTGVFNPTRHDTTNKVFSAFYGSKTIAGRTGADGAKELDDFLAMIFVTPNPAAFICRKIYRFFLYYNITADVETNIIQPLATIFRNNNYEIKPVLFALFSSQHFFDMANVGRLLKSPLEFVVGSIREFNVKFPDATNYVAQYAMWGYAFGRAASMNQQLGDPPNVAGWPAYYQIPSYHELWIDTNTLPIRLMFTDQMVSGGYTTQGQNIFFDVITYVKGLPNPSDPNLLITDSLQRLYRIPVQADFMTYLKEILLSGQISDHYWTDAWAAYIATPTDPTALNVVITRLKTFYKYMMEQSEYQLS